MPERSSLAHLHTDELFAQVSAKREERTLSLEPVMEHEEMPGLCETKFCTSFLYHGRFLNHDKVSGVAEPTAEQPYRPK